MRTIVIPEPVAIPELVLPAGPFLYGLVALLHELCFSSTWWRENAENVAAGAELAMALHADLRPGASVTLTDALHEKLLQSLRFLAPYPPHLSGPVLRLLAAIACAARE